MSGWKQSSWVNPDLRLNWIKSSVTSHPEVYSLLMHQACIAYGPLAACGRGLRELPQLQKMLQQPHFGYIINCRSKISFKPQQTKSIC